MSTAYSMWKRAYKHTKRGFLCSTYENMRSRVLGRSSARHIYNGLPLLPRNVFYMWAMGEPAFHLLWGAWVKAGYPRGLTPSVDRKMSSMGYTIDNMQWLSQSENAGKADHRGTRSGSAKLSETQVHAIRRATGRTHRQLARDYGVGKTTIGSIRSGETWAHL